MKLELIKNLKQAALFLAGLHPTWRALDSGQWWDHCHKTQTFVVPVSRAYKCPSLAAFVIGEARRSSLVLKFSWRIPEAMELFMNKPFMNEQKLCGAIRFSCSGSTSFGLLLVSHSLSCLTERKQCHHLCVKRLKLFIFWEEQINLLISS